MKCLLFITTLLLSLLPCTIEANGQGGRLSLNDSNPRNEITPEIQKEITKVINEVVKKYGNSANFWDETFETFDDDKYAKFLGLFSGSATVVNDIGSIKTILHYTDYAALVFKSLQIEGVPFEIENVEIQSIEIDDTGFYLANVAFDKIVYGALTKKDKFYPIKKAKESKLHMQIDMPDYLISDARIRSIHNPPKQGFAQTINGWYLNFMQWPIFQLFKGKEQQLNEKNLID